MPLKIFCILSVLTAFGPMAIDLYLPSFPTLAQVFNTDVAHVQWSLAAYFAGLALGQLLYGPLIDRYGRRSPLLVGIALFVLASLACALATSLEQIILARFVQALGGCVGLVASRVIVRDLCDPPTTAKVFSRLLLIMGLAPILAPLLGGFLLTLSGWPSIFFTLAAFGAATWWTVLRHLPETYPVALAPAPLSGALKQYLRLWADRRFLGHTLTGGLAMAGMYAYIAGSPYVFIELYSVPAGHYGWVFGSNAAGYILMAQLNAYLLRYQGPLFWLRRWLVLYLACALALVGVALTQPDALWPLLIPLFGCIASLGCIMPNATACALADQGEHAGSASALLGSLQFVLAVAAAGLVGLLHNASALPLASVIGLCGVLASLSALWTARQ